MKAQLLLYTGHEYRVITTSALVHSPVKLLLNVKKYSVLYISVEYSPVLYCRCRVLNSHLELISTGVHYTVHSTLYIVLFCAHFVLLILTCPF